MTLDVDDIKEVFDKLDDPCWSCRDRSKPPSIPDDEHGCGICRGRCYILNDAGHLLIRFLERHGITAEEAQP